MNRHKIVLERPSPEQFFRNGNQRYDFQKDVVERHQGSDEAHDQVTSEINRIEQDQEYLHQGDGQIKQVTGKEKFVQLVTQGNCHPDTIREKRINAENVEKPAVQECKKVPNLEVVIVKEVSHVEMFSTFIGYDTSVPPSALLNEMFPGYGYFRKALCKRCEGDSKSSFSDP